MQSLLPRDNSSTVPDELVWTVAVDLISRQLTPEIVVPALLHGIFTVLCFGSLATIFFKHLRSKHNPISTYSWKTTGFLTAALLILLASSTVYLVINSINGTYYVLLLNQVDFRALLTSTNQSDIIPMKSWFKIDTYNFWTTLSGCTGTAALTTNILIGDSIVWWRTCVVWPHNWPVRVLGFVLIITTFVMGVVDSSKTCAPLMHDRIDYTPPGILYLGSNFGVAATALSLATNILATVLVAYKFWNYRNVLRKYVVLGSQVARLEKALAMLLESGVAYCGIWVVVTIGQVAGNSSKYASDFELHPHPTFFEAFGIFLNSALVHFIAIYPTFVIVLVAFDRSHFELGMASGARKFVGSKPGIDGADEGDHSDREAQEFISSKTSTESDTKRVWIE